MNENQGWLAELQHFVDHMIERIYQWPASERTTLRIMQSIEEHISRLSITSFPDYGCYYIHLAQIIDHFLKQTNQNLYSPDMIWFCKYWETFDHGRKLTLNHVVVEHSQGAIKFKKYVVSRNRPEVKQYCKAALHCSEHMFKTIPDQIETYNLTNGISYIEWYRNQDTPS